MEMQPPASPASLLMWLCSKIASSSYLAVLLERSVAALRWAAAAELATWLPGGTPLGCSWSAGRWVAARQSRRTPVAVPTTRSLRKEREPQATSSCALPAAVRTAATSSARALELADR